MDNTKFELIKLAEEIKLLKKPWFKKVESWVALFAILSSIGTFSLQYTLHDEELLIARSEKNLSIQEKIKAENEKYFVEREKIELKEKLGKYQTDISLKVNEYNAYLATNFPNDPLANELLNKNKEFLASVTEIKKEVLAATLNYQDHTITAYSPIDQVISSIISLLIPFVLIFFFWRHIKRNDPEIREKLQNAWTNLSTLEDKYNEPNKSKHSDAD